MTLKRHPAKNRTAESVMIQLINNCCYRMIMLLKISWNPKWHLPDSTTHAIRAKNLEQRLFSLPTGTLTKKSSSCASSIVVKNLKILLVVVFALRFFHSSSHFHAMVAMRPLFGSLGNLTPVVRTDYLHCDWIKHWKNNVIMFTLLKTLCRETWKLVQILNCDFEGLFIFCHSLVIQGCGDTQRKMVLPVGSWHQIEVELIQISIKRIVA